MIRRTSLPAPFFETRPAPEGRERLLLISYYFPPAQAAGALRWQKMSGLLAAHGYAFDVVTRDPACMAHVDERSLRDLPAGTRLFAIPEGELPLDRLSRIVARLARRVARGRAAAGGRKSGSVGPEDSPRPQIRSLPAEDIRWDLGRSSGWTRAYEAWRHFRRELAWAARAAREAELLERTVRYGAVVTCGPPHAAHFSITRHVDSDVRLVLDMRDPWSLQQRLPEDMASPVWFRLAGRYERRAFERATVILCNTDPAREAMEARYPEIASRFLTVRNGHDGDPLPPREESRRFVIAFAGTIYLDRDPQPLLRAVREVVRELGLGPEELSVELIGNVETFGGVPLSRIAAREGLQEYVHLQGYMARGDLVERLRRATLLVSLAQDSTLAIPSKLYEYMRFHAWILALAEPDSATAKLLAESEVAVVSERDVSSIAEVIRNCFHQFRAHGRPRPMASEEAFSRQREARKLVGSLEALSSGEGSP